MKRLRRGRGEPRAAEVYRKPGTAKLCLVAFLAATLALPPNASAGAITWTGSANNSLYNDPANWVCPTCGVMTYPNNTPTLTFEASIGAGGQAYTTNVNTSATINSMTTGARTNLNISGGNTLTLGTGSTGVVLSNGGVLNIDQSGQLNLIGASASLNTGSISVAGTLGITGAASLTGAGVITMNGGTISGAGGSLSTDNTISGAGLIQTQLSNSGTVQASSGILSISTLADFDAQSLNNNGTYVTGNNHANLQIGNASAGIVTNNANIVLNGTGLITDAANNDILSPFLTTNNGSLTIGDGTTLTLSAGLTNNGNIFLNSAGNTSTLSFSNGGTLTGSGTLTMSDNANNLIAIGAGKTLINDVNHTIQGAGTIGNTLAAFTNNGTLTSDSILGNALIVNATLTNWDGTTLNGGNYNASATLQLSSIGGNQIAGLANNANVAITGATGFLTGDGIVNALGTLSTITDSSLTYANTTATITPNGGNLTVLNDGNIFGATSSLNVLACGNLTVTGSLTNTVADFGNSSTIMVGGASTLNVTGAFSQTTSALAGGQATVTLDGASTMNIGGSFTQDTLSALTLSGGSTLTAMGLSNAGTITVNDSSVADFRGGVFQNLAGGNTLTGGTYNISGTLNYTGNAIGTLSGANIQLNNGGQILFGAAGTQAFFALTNITDSNLALYSSSTLTSITPGGSLLTISGVTNNSSLLLDGTNLQVNGGLSLLSAGPNTPSASLTVQNSSTLTATGAYSQTSNTTTTVSSGSMLFANGFNNGGTINVDGTSTADFSFGSGAFQNLQGGTLTGGTYNIAGVFKYNGLAINALDQANVSLTGTGQMGGAQSFANLKAITDSSLTLNNSTAVPTITPAGGTLAISSDIQNAVGQTSSLTLNGGTLQINGNVTNTNLGAASSVNVLAGGSLTTSGSFTQTGGSTLVGSTTFQGTIPAGAGTLTVNGMFAQSAGSLLQVEDGGVVTARGLSNSGSSQIFVDATSKADFSSGAFLNLSGGTLTGGSYKIAGQLLFAGGPITTIAMGTSVDLSGTGAMTSGGVNALSGVLLNNAGTLTLEGGAKFTTGTGTFSNSGTVTLLGGSAVTVAGSFTNTGTLNVGSVLEAAPGSKEQFTSNGFTNNGVVVVGFGSKATVGTLNNLKSGTLQGGTYAIDGTFNYTGTGIQSIGTGTTLTLDARRTATNASITDTAGTDAIASLQDVAGTLALSGNQSETVGNGAADFTVDASGALLIGAAGSNLLNSYTGEGGNGTLTIDTSLTSAGDVTVGNASQLSVGTLMVDGSFTQTGGDTTADGSLTVTGSYDEEAAGMLTFDLNTASIKSDDFTVDGNATLNGILDINLVNGYTPALTGTPLLTLLTFGSLIGDFSSLELSINGVRANSFGNQLTFTEIKTATSIELQVASTPEPSTWVLLALGLAAFGSLKHRRRIQ